MKATVRSSSLALAAALLSAPLALASEKAPGPARPDAKAAFQQLKALAGQWESGGPSGDKVVVTYRVASGGSVVMEDLFPGTAHEMITMYHLDGDALVLTHYCAMGNQPRMRLSSASPGELRFDFAGGSNLDAAKDAHVHAGLIKFLGPNRLEAEWAVYQGGKQVGTNRFTLERRAAAP